MRYLPNLRAVAGLPRMKPRPRVSRDLWDDEPWHPGNLARSSRTGEFNLSSRERRREAKAGALGEGFFECVALASCETTLWDE